MKGKYLRFKASLILFVFLIASALLFAFAIPALSQDKNTSDSAPEPAEPAIKAGGGNILPTAKNLSDVKGMIFPQKALYNHIYHNPKFCRVLGAKLELVDKQPVEYVNGIVYLKGSVTLRVKVDKKCAGYGLTNGHGVKLCIDGNLFLQNDFLFVKDTAIKDKNAKAEWEEIWLYNLDTTRFTDGPHVIIVNVCDHFDHYGVDSIRCVIRNKER